MQLDIIRNILSSISLVMLIAYLLTRLEFVRRFIATDKPSYGAQALLAVAFGFIGILSTYTGAPVQGAIANTRVIGVMAGGILGGPIVGIGAGLIAGLHRLLIDIGGFTAVACTVSTLLEGVIAGACSGYLKRNRNNGLLLFSVTFLAELVQMATILLIARPYAQALNLVELIFLPMTFLNSIGVAFFVKIFESVFLEQDRASGAKVRLALEIAEQCLPFLRKGLSNNLGLRAAVSLIRQRAGAEGVMITDQTTVLAASGAIAPIACQSLPLPQVIRSVLADGETRTEESAPPGDAFFEYYQNLAAISAPLTQHDGSVIGTLTLLVPRYQRTMQAEYGFTKGLAGLFSSQLALSQIEYQKKLLDKAEYTALQSQINPHFFFNALSTITAFCREKPERARELLIVLATYFRGTLKEVKDHVPLRQELELVNCYLALEKARFEEKLQISLDVPPMLQEFSVPSFILQPLVENAVKHGAMSSGQEIGRLRICARALDNTLYITVRDNGKGVPPQILQQLSTGRIASESVGLSNVQKRLQSLFGPAYGLRIRCSAHGTRVVVRIPIDSADWNEPIREERL